MVAAILAGLAAISAPAWADAQNLSGQVDRGGAVATYTTGRTIDNGGADIYLRFDSGPNPTNIRWYKCGYPGTHGAWKTFSPTPEDQALGTNFQSGATFCLQAYRVNGTWYSGSDTWSGRIAWDVFNNPF